ncbi:MAG TPA: peptide MFS transporter, partial [Polyangiaceae bacterium]|nr:peptide MFS transporter [Polyangiaceae bacterium]
MIATASPERSERHHPRGLYALFFTEMWERFCYYGMRALLVLYLIQYHGWQPSQASTVYKWYSSLVYLTPLAGGLLADRVLGLRLSIIIGGVLMAAGEASLTFTSLPMFYLGLGLLIVGNGFFKPNISTTVGKMYRQGDSRRDRAFTIFYMGINLGAGLSPILCGYLREHYGFRYGFAAAGVGMLIALAVFLSTQGQVLRDVEAAGNDLNIAAKKATGGTDATSLAREASEATPAAVGAAGMLARGFLFLMLVVAVALPLDYVWRAARGEVAWTDVLMPIAFGAISGWMALTLRRIRGASRDKSIVIFIFFMFAVLFWMAFEQAGNALTLWAQFHTELAIGGFQYPAEWWQSVNAVLIVAFAPLFARLWMWLGERGREPSTPMKMFAAMIMMTLSFVAMVVGARVENASVTRQALDAVPAEVPQKTLADGRVVVGEGDAGRLTYRPSDRQLEVHGVLPRYVVNEMLRRTAPGAFVEEVNGLEALTRQASTDAPVRVAFAATPAGFTFPFEPADAAERGVSWDEAGRAMTFTRWAEAPTIADLAAAGAPPSWRDPVWSLEKKSEAARVSGVWLLLSYLFATLGELCLSPVGLSMVTKLAPARFASLFMGVWLLASSVAQYAGGSIGESWGIIAPSEYFMVFVWTSIGGAVVLALLVKP